MGSHQNVNRRKIIVGSLVLIGVAIFLYVRMGRNGTPCRPIVKACKDEGIEITDQGGRKAMFKNCIFPAIQNGSIGNTTFEQPVLDACKTYMQQQRAKREN